MRLAFQIALTHLLSRKRQTLVATMGVMFGIGVYVFMTSLMTGTNNFMDQLTMMVTPHLRIYKEASADRKSIIEQLYPESWNVVHHQKPKQEQLNLKDGMKLVAFLQNDSRTLAVSPQLNTQVFYNIGSIQINGTISGVSIKEEDKLFDIKSKMIAGSLDELALGNESIVMGKGLAKKLKVNVGDRVTITTPFGQTMRLKVVGIFRFGIGTMDNIRSYANLGTVQKILQRNSAYITDINIRLKDFTLAPAMAGEYKKIVKANVDDWLTVNAPIQTQKSIRNIINYAVSFTLLLVAGFGIYNILNMAIYNKMKDIAILKAIGFSSIDVRNVFLIQALLIGAAGSSLGVVFGYVSSYLFSLKKMDFGSEWIELDHMPMSFEIDFYIVGVVFGIITTALAGYFPSRKAGSVDPVQILRG